jgi:hypothetical protein
MQKKKKMRLLDARPLPSARCAQRGGGENRRRAVPPARPRGIADVAPKAIGLFGKKQIALIKKMQNMGRNEPRNVHNTLEKTRRRKRILSERESQTLSCTQSSE